ncbi:ATP-binding protein [Segetibacter sp.]|jgi:PAS domain S-box-containing protein|uniref:ATP-binding protein n=1 Tax=Segetibacter sp. TaxID=2231182 RepID=UPI00261B78C2|nr:ATP-binding protein [Segetibacter sp.]MCW3080441.1 hybrid sensor histidine kinase/response regulator [Segetibacter sp.]
MQSSALQILVIEDNPGDYLLVNEYLEEAFPNAAVFHGDTLQKGIGFLEKEKIDIILLDLSLPDGMGISSFHSINSSFPRVPVIILTGLGDTEIALEILKVGAQDFIVKDDSNAAVLAKSINYGIERSKILERLKKSEEQYKFLFNNNPLPICAYDIELDKILMVNEAAIEHYGYSEKEFLNMTMAELQPYHTIKGSPSPVSSEKKGSQNLILDVKHQKKNGDIIDIEIRTHEILMEGRRAYLAVIHDVTETNRAKEQLRESEQMFRTISENFPNGAVAILNKDFTTLYTAGKEFHIKDRGASHFENTDYTSHFHSPVKEKVRMHLQKVFEGENAVFEASYEDLSYMISAVPLYEPWGSINKILIASQNITEQKRNETEKEMLIEELTQNNSDLRQFSYITSHNLRAPLSNLLGIIKLLDTSLITDPMTILLLKNFEECTLQLNETVNDLLNVLIIKNNVNAKKEPLDISKIFERVLHSVQTAVEKKQATISTDFDDASEVLFNRTYLESILLNLVTNAVKYSSPDRALEIKVKTKKTTDGVILYFADNGLGIDLQRYKDRIFGLYQRFHDHADSKGLGLYIVNSQIRVMGGEIDVESEVDKGTTFIITFKN